MNPIVKELATEPELVRLNSGELAISVAEPTWPEEWYLDPYRRVSIPLALQLAREVLDVKQIHVWYDREQDFHHIDFDVDGESYSIQWYKVFTLKRNRDGAEVMFGRYSHRIPEFFARSKHKEETKWYKPT